MSKTVLVSAIKQLVKCLKSLNVPVTIDQLLQACNLNIEGISQLKEQLASIMEMGIKLGYIKRCNDHYFASTHVDDVLIMLDSSFDPQLPDADPADLFQILFTQPPINDNCSHDNDSDNTSM